MHGQALFLQAFIYLAAAVVSVPLAKRVGLGSVLGYLLAGIAIGPYALGFVGAEGQDVMHFAEFGVVMMLFLIGLELRLSSLWKMRKKLLGMGGTQVLVTAGLIALIAGALGQPLRVAVAVGLILSLSSTAIVLQTLQEKGLMKTEGGDNAFSVLLFQDIAVIPMLALLPLLATHAPVAASYGEGHATTWVEGLPGWGQTLVVLGAVISIVIGGRYLTRPIFRAIARTRLQEVFTAAALLLVIGIALLMNWVGLSPALGTFLAGVVLGESEYRHELESDVEPFKGLLLGLFFIAVGASIDFTLIAGAPVTIAGLVTGLIALKLVVLLVLGRVFKMAMDQRTLFAFVLAQGEFGFVLFSFATQSGVLTSELAGLLVAVVALSMMTTPMLVLFNERVLQPRLAPAGASERLADRVDEDNAVIIAGHGRFGQIVGRLLRAKGVRATVLESDPDQVDLLRRFGFRVFYGDSSRAELLRAAGADQAKLLVVAVDGPDKILEIAEIARKHFPHLTVLARAKNRTHAAQLLEAGVEHIYRETFDSALRVGVDALRALGFPGHLAHRSARTFRRHDEESLRLLGAPGPERPEYLREAKNRVRDIERILKSELEERPVAEDAAWDPVSRRKEFGGTRADEG